MYHYMAGISKSIMLYGYIYMFQNGSPTATCNAVLLPNMSVSLTLLICQSICLYVIPYIYFIICLKEHVMFVLLGLAYLTNMLVSSWVHFVAKGRILLFVWLSSIP